jgi:hypothetical protein
MRSLVKLSANIFRTVSGRKTMVSWHFSPEAVLKRSLGMLDANAARDLKKYVEGRQHVSGAFKDRAENPDLYYTLFGTLLSEALGLEEILMKTRQYVENEICSNEPAGIHLYCASILASKLSVNRKLKAFLRKRVRKNLDDVLVRQPVYGMFVTMLACYYSGDYKGLFKIRRHLKSQPGNETLPSTVIAALTVLQHTFGRPTGDLIEKLRDFYDNRGGFRAVKRAPVPDLLSTAVTLYACSCTHQDLKIIRPECLNFIDSLYQESGLGASMMDPEPDIEYTFYGLLALGSLA